MTWPREAGELDAFYGDPRGSSGASPAWAAANLTTIVPQWRMVYAGKPVAGITIHRKCAESLTRVLNAIWDHYGRNQSRIDAAHLNEFDGSYNYRVNRNNPAKLSVHSYGAALDLAARWNPNGKAWVDGGEMMPRAAIEAFKAEGWAWGGQFGGTKDAMHFQATFDPHVGESLPGQPKPSPAPDGRTFTNIVATVFGGAGDEQPAAYPDVKPGWPDRPGVALPYHFTGLPRRLVRVTNAANGKSVDCEIVDVGPWYPSKRGPADQYWTVPAMRPRAEGDPNTNGAGIDLTPAAAKAIGLDGKGVVSWSFVPPATPPSTPPRKDIPVSTPVTVSAGFDLKHVEQWVESSNKIIDQFAWLIPANFRWVALVPELVEGALEAIIDIQSGPIDQATLANKAAGHLEGIAKTLRASVAASQPVDVQGRAQ